MKAFAAFLFSIAGSVAWAQSMPAEFPSEAISLSASNLQDLVSGKVYAVKLANGVSWRMEFRAGGAYFFNTSRDFSDTGKWSTQDGKLCTDGPKINTSCNEVRKLGDSLLLKRDNGSVVTMTAQ